MDTGDFVATYEAAIANERAAWALVRDRLPGSPAFDARLWRDWKNAVKISCASQEVLTTLLEQKHRKPGQ